ncbi:unnamed protein product [Caretta caretta]
MMSMVNDKLCRLSAAKQKKCSGPAVGTSVASCLSKPSLPTKAKSVCNPRSAITVLFMDFPAMRLHRLMSTELMQLSWGTFTLIASEISKHQRITAVHEETETMKCDRQNPHFKFNLLTSS